VPRSAVETKRPSAGDAASAPRDDALAVHKSPAQLRLETLQREHERLLREITKKRAAFELVEREARDAASELAAKVIPLRERYFATLAELRAIFEELLGEQSHLNKRDKARVRRLYARLLPGLERDGGEDDGDDEAGYDGGEPNAPPRGSAAGNDEGEAGYSATKPSEKNTGLLRSLFRKLAVALHPDKVQDEKERATLTSIMKEVTRAYESGDVARLVEIERTWLAQAPVPERELDVARRIGELLAANKELRRQLRALTADLKELKQSSVGHSAPRRRGAREPRSEVDEMVSHFERELAELVSVRNFAQRFADGEIDIKEFLLGPEPLEDEDDPFEQMLAEVLEAMAADAPPARKAPRARRRQKR
jgi:hypothetical protein